MPPKRNKSATPSGVTPTGPAAANKNWETALTAAVFEEVIYQWSSRKRCVSSSSSMSSKLSVQISIIHSFWPNMWHTVNLSHPHSLSLYGKIYDESKWWIGPSDPTINLFLCNGWNKVIQVWNHVRVSKWCLVIILGWTIPLNKEMQTLLLINHTEWMFVSTDKKLCLSSFNHAWL